VALIERIFTTSAAVTCMAFWIGCVSPTPPVVSQTRDSYENAAADTDTARHAAVQLYEAEKVVTRLESEAEEGASEAKLDHLAYLAKRRIELARIEAERAVTRERVAELSKQRDALMLQTRTREAQQARGVAEARSQEAERARREAEVAMQRARQLERELKDLEAKRTAEGLQLTMRGVLFAFDSDELQPGARTSLARIAEFLNGYPNQSVSVDGHTDSVGSDTYNQTLSERRARSTADYLTTQGVARGRISVRGHGESQPVAPNDTDAGRQQNRRVEILLKDPEPS
jgi:outer membrane protein OmpA-like peptidoglycan-associated protein